MPDQTVLIADDNHGVRRMVQMVLADAGCAAREWTGRRGLQTLITA